MHHQQTGAPPISPLDELEQIVARGESDDIEFRTSTGQRTEAVKTVCAMLNGTGGYVLFGVTGRGIIVGQDVSTDTLDALLRELRRIEPRALVVPETIPLPSRRAVVLLRVPRGGGAPHTYDGRPYVRAGGVTGVMPREQYERRLAATNAPAVPAVAP